MTNQHKQSSEFRSPVVVVVGHVDHGKTKLLDSIRKTHVMEKESGGITQHIGAYQVEANGKTITFLDTPGHEAFSAIRSRGVKVADIAILVVAADESVRPQTKEAIQTILSAGIPFIVALNKIDKPAANVQKVKQDLAAENVLVEDWGGKVPVVEISAKTGQGIPELLEMILLVAEVEELKKDTTLPAQGVIIESHLDQRRGYVATALIQKGILSIGDFIVTGTAICKIKSMENFRGQTITQASVSEPVLITGWSKSPDIGREFINATNKNEAQDLAATNIDLSPLFKFFSDSLGEPGQIKNEKKWLNIVFKSDVTSSLEALDSALQTVPSTEVGYRVLAYDIGNISESDIKTALSTKAKVFGFRVGVEESARKLAEKEGIEIKVYDVIYELIEAVRRAMGELLEPEVKKTVLGKLKILAVFKTDPKSQIVGGRVMSGKISRGALVDLVRSDSPVLIGKLGQLQKDKEDIIEVKEGSEAGLRLDMADSKTCPEVKVGDILEVYEEEKIKREI